MYFQGNNIGVYDKTGKLVQRTDYYASGEPWLEPEYGNGAYGNRYLFGGKERMAGGELNEYDFEARNSVISSLPDLFAQEEDMGLYYYRIGFQ